MRVLHLASVMVLLAASYGWCQPEVDYHQHLLSPTAAKLGSLPASFTARDLMPLLDAAGTKQAVVLSLAYQYGNPNKPAAEDEYARVREENDWTANEVSQFPDRLIGFCGVDPLKMYALAEIDRCAKNRWLNTGLKLHFGNSDVDLDNPEHVAAVRHVFEAADRHGMAIVVHLRSSVTRKRPYGAREARVFLEQVLPSAPHVTVQIAHLAGSGGYEDPAVDQALGVFVDSIKAHDARMAYVVFDISGVAGLGAWQEKKSLIATRIRQVGVGRILWGSDGAFGGGLTPEQAIKAYRELPLTAEEFRAIDGNVAPYLRHLRGSRRFP